MITFHSSIDNPSQYKTKQYATNYSISVIAAININTRQSMNKHTSAYQTEVREKGNETALL
jgi:hypothetical protein